MKAYFNQIIFTTFVIVLFGVFGIQVCEANSKLRIEYTFQDGEYEESSDVSFKAYKRVVIFGKNKSDLKRLSLVVNKDLIEENKVVELKKNTFCFAFLEKDIEKFKHGREVTVPIGTILSNGTYYIKLLTYTKEAECSIKNDTRILSFKVKDGYIKFLGHENWH